jgi:TonB family protein
MKFLSRLLLLCIFGWGSSFAQNSAPVISASNCEKPEYPSASKRLEEEGTVQLKFLVDVDGKVIESAVQRSSGSRRLDEAARAGLAKCQFKPAMVDGVPKQSWSSMTYVWELKVFQPCRGTEVAKWNRCLGSLPTSIGGLIVVEFVNGKKYGRGVEYDQNGRLIRSGDYDGEKLYFERTLETNRYPFNPALLAKLPNPTNVTIAQITNPPNSSSQLVSLPICQGDKTATWNNCFGTYIFPSGEKYIGEFKNNLRHGQGTFYTSNGMVVSEGVWAEGKLVRAASFQQPSEPNSELAKLRADAEEAKRKQIELEEQLKLALQRPSNPPSEFSSTIGKRIALVVGNANYKVRPLKNPKNDADDVSRSLKATGFDVIDLRDATLPQMRTAVRQFGDRLINNDVGLVYYSGHGVEVKGRNYFIPVNADIQREDEIADQGLDVSLILEKMNTAGKGVNILIVDACRDDPFGRSFRSSSRGLAQMDAPRGTIIAYATSPGKVASDGDPRERNSPYTKHLVKAMQSPNKPIEQVFKEVRRAVQDETKNQQTPWENTSLSGDFFFRVQR